MDPFTITTGIVGLVDVCTRFASFLSEAKDGFRNTDKELARLEKQLSAVLETITQVSRIHEASVNGVHTIDKETEINHWQATDTNIKGCRRAIDELLDLVMVVCDGKTKIHPKIDQFRKFLRLQSKEGKFIELQKDLGSFHGYLQMNLNTAILFYTTDIASQVSKIRTLQAEMRALWGSTGSSSDASRELTLASAETVLEARSLNEHFYPPRGVSSLFTGRQAELDTLERLVFGTPSSNAQKQKRFVIYGPPGSGKTEFCSKFASDNKHKFWAVFYIVASSREHASQAFAQIAQYGKVDPNERAAKNWLSTVGAGRPWLLIIDNVDDDGFDIEDFYPDGKNGVILITSRMATMRTQGTIGQRYFEFRGLDDQSSRELLLTAADKRWSECSDSARQAVKDICDRLGHLPLALTHAGKIIHDSPASIDLENYLSFFENNWVRVREMKRHSHGDEEISDANAVIYASYDLIHHNLEKKASQDQASYDALDLLRIFAFFHHQRIRVDVLWRAAGNPKRVKELQAQQTLENERLALQNPGPAASWQQMLQNSLVKIVTMLSEKWNPPVLPRMVSRASTSGNVSQVCSRVMEALKKLSRFSLVFYSAEDKTYSLHPAVHYWLREGPHMTFPDQAVWSSVAATLLSQAILPPPWHNAEEEENLRRDLVSHVASVQHYEQKIRREILEKQQGRIRQWPDVQLRFDRHQALQYFKFSLVYAQGGQFEKAKELQEEVLEFVTKRLGPGDSITINLQRLLAGTMWILNLRDESAELRERILEVSKRVRGEHHRETLVLMDEYGSSLWQQGRYAKALEYHTAAVEGFEKLLGPDHEDTLRAMGNLGRVYLTAWRYTEALAIQTASWTGLCKRLGEDDPHTLVARDNLAMSYFERYAYGHGQPNDLDKALELEEYVYRYRKDRLGKEHLLTLWAGLNVARIKGLSGRIDEALAISRAGHEIAVRNLGESHFAVLFGRTHYGRILTYAEQYEEAELVLSEVIVKTGTNHPDRVLALFSLIKCRKAMGRIVGVPELTAELIVRVRSLFPDDHPAVKYILDPRNEVIDADNPAAIAAQTPPSPRSDEALGERERRMLARYGHMAVHQEVP